MTALSSLLLTSAFLGLLVVDITYPEEKRDENFYLFEISISCFFFFVVIPILKIMDNKSMTQYILNKLYNLKFVSDMFALIVLIKSQISIMFTVNKVYPINDANNVWVTVKETNNKLLKVMNLLQLPLSIFDKLFLNVFI